MDISTQPSKLDTKRRRSRRVILCVPVTVSGDSVKGPFSEDTHTLVVNAHGALVLLAAEVLAGQLIQVRSRAHSMQQVCRICYLGPTVEGKTQIGVEFAKPAPDFWQISFPPEDWTPDEESAILGEESKSYP